MSSDTHASSPPVEAAQSALVDADDNARHWSTQQLRSLQRTVVLTCWYVTHFVRDLHLDSYFFSQSSLALHLNSQIGRSSPRSAPMRFGRSERRWSESRNVTKHLATSTDKPARDSHGLPANLGEVVQVRSSNGVRNRTPGLGQLQLDLWDLCDFGRRRRAIFASPEVRGKRHVWLIYTDAKQP